MSATTKTNSGEERGMKKADLVAAIRAARKAPGHEQRIDDWLIWATRVYRRGCPGPAWTAYIYAQRDGEQYQIGGWSSQKVAAARIIKTATDAHGRGRCEMETDFGKYERCDGSGMGDSPCGALHESPEIQDYKDGVTLKEELLSHACQGCGEYTPGYLTGEGGLCPDCQ